MRQVTDSKAPKNLVFFNTLSKGPMKKRNGAEPHGNVQEVSFQLLYIDIEDHMHNNFAYEEVFGSLPI